MTSIVGVCLVRNEEYFVAWALSNVAKFCDHILVMDNNSTDLTAEILRNIANQHSHVEIIQVPDAYDTHNILQGYFGTDAWMLKVDGDEIYDLNGLEKFRTDLLSDGPQYKMQRGISSMMVHVVSIDFETGQFTGYTVWGERPQGGFILNCNAVKSWSGKNERMHATNPVWHPEYQTDLWHVNEDQLWKEADFRCLHMCFWPRSTQDQCQDSHSKFMSRWNPHEARRQETGIRKFRRKLLPHYYRRRIDHKNRWYRNNDLKTFDDLNYFGRPEAFCSLNPKTNELIDRLASISNERLNAIGNTIT